MSIRLIESEHRAQRSLGGTFVSIALHASLITLAVYATANAGEMRVMAPVDGVIKFYPPQMKQSTHNKNPGVHSEHPSTIRPTRRTGLEYSPRIPDSLPPI